MKRYRLVKAIQSPMGECKAGTESIFEHDYYIFPYIGHSKKEGEGWLGSGFMIHSTTGDLSGFPEWYQEIKEERIEVLSIGMMDFGKSRAEAAITITTNDEIPESKFPAIKKAIEGVLNEKQDGDPIVNAQHLLYNAGFIVMPLKDFKSQIGQFTEDDVKDAIKISVDNVIGYYKCWGSCVGWTAESLFKNWLKQRK